MDISISGETKTYGPGTTVAQLLALEKVETPEYVTVAVNEEFVDAPLASDRVLRDGDRVEFLYFMGGGRQWP